MPLFFSTIKLSIKCCTIIKKKKFECCTI